MTVRLPVRVADERGWLRVPFPHPAWMSTRSSGDMRQAPNRERLYAAIGLPANRVLRLRQVHSRRVLVAEDLPQPSVEQPELPEGDGLVSGPGGPYLAVGVGDCMPILLCDTRTGAYGLLHSGWRGTGIVSEAVRAMNERYGTDAGDIVAHLGPCISGSSYEVDAARADEYLQWGPSAVVLRGDRPYLDMRAANLELSRRAGIGSVVVADNCTFQTPQLGSFRREGPSGYTGMLVIVGARDREEGS